MATRRPRSAVDILGLRYVFTCLVERKFFGYVPTWIGPCEVPIASPEKAILDSLDHPGQAGGVVEIAKAIAAHATHLNERHILHCLHRMGKGAVAKRLGYLLELLGVAGHILPRIHSHLRAGYSLLDPTLGQSGPYLSRWRLRVNIPPAQLLASIGT